MVNEADVRLFADKCKAIFEQVGRDIIGQEDIVELTVIAMIAGGNVLLEGVPGIGKTRLIRSLGRVFSLPFSRIQFTPDLMPADITGTNVLEKDEKAMRYTRSAPARFSATSCWRMRSTAPRRIPGRAAGSHAGAYGDGGRQGLSHGGAVFRAGDAEPDRAGAPTPCRRRRWIASCSSC